MKIRLRVLVAAAAALTCGIAPSMAATEATSSVRLHVDGHPPKGSVLTTMANTGSIPVRVDVARLYNGTTVADRDREGKAAVKTPVLRKSSSAPRAIVRVTHRAQQGDPLAPGTKNFRFGATFKKDALSTGSPVDNGDNVVQRGLASDPAQYKLEVDTGRAACQVKGDRGTVFVRSTVEVRWDRWFTAQCSRTGDSVSVTVTEHLAGGQTRVTTNTRNGSIGRVSWPKTYTPLSVGGKLAANGAVIRSATDQFNGIISEPYLEIFG